MTKAVPMVAHEKFPWMSEGDALHELLQKHVFEWKECESIIWKEARRLAIIAEGHRQCAALKIQSFFRGYCVWKVYQEHYAAILMIQKTFSMYRRRTEFLKILEEQRREAARRKREIAAKRAARRAALLFREARNVNGTLNVVTVYKHSKGAVLLLVYNPETCEQFQWTISRPELRELLEGALGTTELSVQELYIRPNLSILADKIMYRKRQGKRVVVISKKGYGERGSKLLIRGTAIKANATVDEGPTSIFHVVSIYEYHGDYVFRAYEPIHSHVKQVRLSDQQLRDWFKFDPADTDVPPLLRLSNRDKLLDWFLSRMFICRACGLRSHRGRHARGENILMLEYEVQEQRLHSMAAKIQGAWRAKKALTYIRNIIKSVIKKQWDPTAQAWYYMNKRTGEVSWQKPHNMGTEDLQDPPDRWEEMVGEDGTVYYYHALTGRTSWMSETQAALLLQRAYRKSQANDFRISDWKQVVRALRFQRDTVENFRKNPTRLSCVVEDMLPCDPMMGGFLFVYLDRYLDLYWYAAASAIAQRERLRKHTHTQKIKCKKNIKRIGRSVKWSHKTQGCLQ